MPDGTSTLVAVVDEDHRGWGTVVEVRFARRAADKAAALVQAVVDFHTVGEAGVGAKKRAAVDVLEPAGADRPVVGRVVGGCMAVTARRPGESPVVAVDMEGTRFLVDPKAAIPAFPSDVADVAEVDLRLHCEAV